MQRGVTNVTFGAGPILQISSCSETIFLLNAFGMRNPDLETESLVWKLKTRFGNQEVLFGNQKFDLETGKARFGNQEHSIWKPTF